MKSFFLLLTMLAVLGGCASKDVRVSCDGRLQPINPPAPIVQDVQQTGAGPARPPGVASPGKLP